MTLDGGKFADVRFGSKADARPRLGMSTKREKRTLALFNNFVGAGSLQAQQINRNKPEFNKQR
jgi:hypothetical protein